VDDLAGLTHESTARDKSVRVHLGTKTAKRIIASIEASKRRDLSRVLGSLGIPHVGTQTAQIVASQVSDIDALLSADDEMIRAAVSEERSIDEKDEQATSVSSQRIYRNAKLAARAFREALRSDEGHLLAHSAISDAKANGEGDKAALYEFLESIPEPSKTWRVQWGRKRGGRKSLLLGAFADLDELRGADLDAIVDIFDKGVVGRSLYDYLHSENGRRAIDALKEAGVLMTSKKHQTTRADSPLADKTIVITGTLIAWSRSALSDELRSLGANVTSSVSKNTDLVIVGKNPSSKLTVATKLGIETWNEDRLLKVLPRPRGEPELLWEV